MANLICSTVFAFSQRSIQWITLRLTFQVRETGKQSFFHSCQNYPVLQPTRLWPI